MGGGPLDYASAVSTLNGDTGHARKTGLLQRPVPAVGRVLLHLCLFRQLLLFRQPLVIAQRMRPVSLRHSPANHAVRLVKPQPARTAGPVPHGPVKDAAM